MNKYKGILLAGGKGTRLYPLTLSHSKQLLHIYNKPLIYYSLSVLMLANIKDITIICTSSNKDLYARLLGDGSSFGINLRYVIQDQPDGIPQAVTLSKEFIGSSRIALVLGDNLFYGNGFSKILHEAISKNTGCTIFGKYVDDPSKFGVATLDDAGNVRSIEEKPNNPSSRHAITGLYLFDNTAVEKVKHLKKSNRGELEIVDLLNLYLKEDKINFELLGRGFTWLDTGSFDSLLDAGNFVKSVEKNNNVSIGCIEEIAYHNGWIDRENMKNRAKLFNNGYGKILLKVLER